MSRRTHEGPMDFEYQNGTGPIDGRSPFANVSQNARRFPTASPGKSSALRNVESPSRPSHAQPQQSRTPPLSPSKSNPAVAVWNAHWLTPRKTAADLDDSSAGETPKSRAWDDSDATPDTSNLRNALNKPAFASLPSLPSTANPSNNNNSMTLTQDRPTSEFNRRESFFGRIKNKLYSPGRGEVPRGDLTHVKENRVRKAKSRDLRQRSSKNRRLSMSSSASDDEAKQHRRSPRKSPRKISASQSAQSEFQPSSTSWLAETFTFIGQHPTVPHILTFYAQLAFNLFLLAACAYLIYAFWSAIQGDVDKKAWEASAETIAEINSCAEHFRVNGCASSTRVPALEQVCANWKTCMDRDPQRVARASLGAHALAEIFNSFVEPISYKAMIFTAFLVFGCFGISNFAFGVLRDKTAQAQHFNPNPYGWQQPPTPQRSFSGGDGAFYGGTPWQTHMPRLEPEKSGGFGHIEGRGSPQRRLAFS